MQPRPRTAEYYKTLNEDEPARAFVDSLKDLIGKAAIQRRISRAEQTGAFGACHDVGDGVWELIVDVGPGYRVYYSIEHNNTILLLLMAGDKRNQNADIGQANQNRSDWTKRNPAPTPPSEAAKMKTPKGRKKK